MDGEIAQDYYYEEKIKWKGLHLTINERDSICLTLRKANEHLHKNNNRCVSFNSFY